MRVAIAQINSTLGDFSSNSKLISKYINKAAERSVRLLVFPEGSLFGYYPADLLERRELVLEQMRELVRIQRQMPEGIYALVGCYTLNRNKKGRPYYNSAALLCRGKKPFFFNKELLPTGDVFDEGRFVESGNMAHNRFKVGSWGIQVTICEDIWAWPDKGGYSPYKNNPLLDVPTKGIDLVINMSASPWHRKKLEDRKKMVKATAVHFGAPVVYVNLVGGQDELVFDGQSFLTDMKGRTVLQCGAFIEDFSVFDLDDLPSKLHQVEISRVEELRRAIVLGIRDFCKKTGLEKVHLGLSGGIDSAVVAALAADAVGPGRVTGVILPGPFSSPKSEKLAEELGKRLGIRVLKMPIQGIYDQIRATVDMPLGLKNFSVVHENIQARIRGLLLMACANAENSLLLATSNKSEYATGYSTLYGDMCGGLAPIGDLIKQEVYELAQHYNLERELIPREIIERPPTAELRPNQKDQDFLPPYELLDASVRRLVQNGRQPKDKTDRWLLPILMRTEFKRWQAPPIIKISSHAFGRGRRFPIAYRPKVR
ncbi:MAG: NAD+ synthase [Bdellovibrionaceae bacterium]|nr:NAD+ synthase [Pseudobdellovibrionaceae bacterium]